MNDGAEPEREEELLPADIVHGWGDPNDSSWWAGAFAVLKPVPLAEDLGGPTGTV